MAVAAAAPAFASSTQKFAITLFTSRASGSGSSIKYELKLTIRNDGITAASPIIRFDLDVAYGTITGQGPTPVTLPATSGWVGVVSTDKRSITYTNPSYLLGSGQTLVLTFEPVNTSASVVASTHINATVLAIGYTGVTKDDTRV